LKLGKADVFLRLCDSPAADTMQDKFMPNFI